ncbi:hypothetical protein CFO_g801 [Ceratocystis platani]|uniref:Uncharacterized protein n=1 Tax=Ceratocystis fimbriata f. sp. platani TaxID=88771 RepID=A0A0F8BWB5_CERFI|nr:hypothetical protein CFO_g801 [Ceratocystis platani]
MSLQWAQGSVQVTSPAFTQLVVKAMQDMFPETMANRAWDNVGLLLDNTKLASEEEHSTKPVVMLTNDLTYAAAEEAIKGGASVIISYHPIIFRGLKALTTADPQQATLLLLARSGSEVLRGSKAQLWITGELSHHDTLAAIQAGHIVVTAFHSNTERQFLHQRLQPMLSNWLKTSGAADAHVFVSDADHDPYTVVDLGTL